MSDENLRNPFVVQCKSCKKILTDSFSLISYKHGYLIQAFSTIKSIKDSHMGSEIFSNCLIETLACECGQKLGVYMVSSSDEWNGFAGMYCMHKENLISYALGNAVCQDKTQAEIIEDIDKLKNVVSKIYKKVYQ